jgi:hypothetical protein
VRIPTQFYAGTNGASSNASRRLDTGIGVQKIVHPESTTGTYQRIVKSPLPIIRMADLYLMLAEALNQYEGPSQKGWDALNVVRHRAGIPDVETAWSNNGITKTMNKHTDQEGLHEIIMQERSLEFAYEGSYFWDVYRYRKAHVEFSDGITGWNYQGANASTFFVLSLKQARKFSVRDYLWPIPLKELDINTNLIQNPGW